MLLLSSRTIKKTLTYDVVFDCWGENKELNKLYFERFYSVLNNILKKSKVAIFEPNLRKKKSKTISSYYNLEEIHKRSMVSKFIFIRIFKYFTKYIYTIINISIKSNINFVIIFIKILRQYLIHQLNTQNIKCVKYLISAGDNYYTPLMYYIYKKNGVKKIFLIQNGLRTEEFESSFYISCDLYFSLNMQMKNNYIGLKAYDKINYIGSLRLYNSINDIRFTNENYDIVFIEQIAENETLHNKNNSLYPLMENYFLALQYLSNFSSKYKNIKIIYRAKRKEYNENCSTFLQRRNDIIASSNIILDEEIHNNSYESILDSKIVVYSHSTMGLESISLSKKVLCCNFGKFDFLLSNNNEIGVIVDEDYELYENKLLYLLENNEITNIYFDGKRKTYGELSKKPYKIILECMEIK